MWNQVELKNLSQIANKIRLQLKPGVILSINGKIGSGKTTLIKHVLHEYNQVASPSFLHMHFYGDHFAHIDAYTLRDKQHFLAMAIEEILSLRCVIVEWGDLFAECLSIYDAIVLRVEMKHSEIADMRLINVDF